MIEKMCFINLAGNLKNIDHVIENYILKFDIKLENAIEDINQINQDSFVDNQAKTDLYGFEENKNIISAKEIIELIESGDNIEIKKFCAVIKKDFFVFVGWISEKNFNKLKNISREDNKVIISLEKLEKNNKKSPPVVLKNLSIFNPFESLVKMYGVPSYNEIDPTPFLAITYIILFGLMFGDVGQGFVLFLAGLFLKKRGALFKIISMLGVSSILFGFLYGSVFGFEDLIPTIWMKPSDNIIFILTFTVMVGISLILISMIFNLINCKKSNDFLSLILGANSISGLSFYVFILLGFLFLFLGKSSKVFFVLALINLIFIAFAEPIKKLIRHEKNIFGSNIFLFLFETIIELFETLLSYFTNTVSFVRVGAFALSHAGMMGVVMLLSKTDTGYNWPIVILGNLLVIGLEGLIVGIQALRLEFYEMFGRFFKGNGHEYNLDKKN